MNVTSYFLRVTVQPIYENISASVRGKLNGTIRNANYIYILSIHFHTLELVSFLSFFFLESITYSVLLCNACMKK